MSRLRRDPRSVVVGNGRFLLSVGAIDQDLLGWWIREERLLNGAVL